ncbi:MAG: heavy metal-binding domain-containing protein [Limisphaerales bacterium]
MKIKIITVIALAAILAAGAIWFAIPHQLNATEITDARQKTSDRTCPMHPSVKADKPGNCPICGMQLVPVHEADKSTNASMTMPGCCSSGGCGH